MDEIMKFVDYKQFNEAFGREYGRQAEGFVRMGYMLKYARDTNILYESGYKSVAEYAYGEYKLPDYTVTNMIKINDRYSEGGYSDRLADRYRGFGSSLLAEMLTLSDAVIAALPPGTKREEIREIKNEIKEEQKVTDLEVMLEEPEKQEADNNLEQVLRKYYYENRREYPGLHSMIVDGNLTKREVVDLLAPNGTSVKFARVQGIGRFMMSVKGEDQDIELLNVRTNESEKYSWDSCIHALRKLYRGSRQAKEDWEFIYGETFQQEPEKKEEPKEKKNEEEKKPPVENYGSGHGSAEKAAGPKKEEKPGSQDKKRTVTEEKPKVAPAQEPEIMQPPTEPEAQQETAVQQSIAEYKDVLPSDYQAVPEVITRKEVEIWKEATQHAVRLFNTLEAHDWNPDCGKLISEMCMEAGELHEKLRKLDECMRRENG